MHTLPGSPMNNISGFFSGNPKMASDLRLTSSLLSHLPDGTHIIYRHLRGVMIFPMLQHPSVFSTLEKKDSYTDIA